MGWGMMMGARREAGEGRGVGVGMRCAGEGRLGGRTISQG